MDIQYLMAPGGIGLFLLGMLIFTEGLRHLAGVSLRRALTRFTRGPTSGAITGAITTAVIQSSSATTVTAVGFVGAGLLTFPQALGIIFGANIGTTITGWLVALIGFKLKLGLMVLPLLFVGVMLRLFANGRWSQFGWALAGFSLLFVGIDMLQSGMEPLRGIVTPESFPPDTYWGRLQLLLLGVLITLVTQSSSAGVATALVALGAGALSLPQAMAMVIGMDVGTTFTAALATLGGSTAMRRTGFAHVIYNVLTGIMAFFLLDLYVWALGGWVASGPSPDAQLALVGFHTLFNGIGVIAVLPFATRFSRLVQWLVPERGPRLTRQLDDGLLKDPLAATDAALASVRAISLLLFRELERVLDSRHPRAPDAVILRRVDEAIAAVRRYVQGIKPAHGQLLAHRRLMTVMHALDHLSRLLYRCRQEERILMLARDHRLRRLTGLFRNELHRVTGAGSLDAGERRFDRLRELFREQRHVFRDRMVAEATSGGIDAGELPNWLDSMRWLHRASYHVWRISHHMLQDAETGNPDRQARDEPETLESLEAAGGAR